MDYKKLNDDELIELCKEKGIEYFNSKTKKNYAKSTLISRLNKDTIKNTDQTKIETELKEEEIVNIEYKNEVIWTLSDEDKKNNDEYKEIENKLLNCIKSCHNYLYSNGAITGLKASNDIIRIIIFRLLNIIYKNDDIKLEIRNKISVENLEKYEKYLIDIKEFNKSLNIDNDIKLYIMKIIIPILPNVFNSDDMIFNMRNYPKNYNTIINKISELIDINNSELFIKLFADTGGNIYEYFTNSYGKGNSSKELGQFFTPFKLINLLLFNIKDYILIDDNYSLYDPCCGSGGLLNRTSSFLNINKNNIYGCEIEKDTIKYALASILFNNNNSLKINILNNCSLSNNKYIFENKKFNLILTNPPFGTDMTYKDLKSKFEEYRDYNFKSSSIKFEDVYPVNTNNGPSLFLQHVIYMLEDNGICGIVLPDGNELTNNGFYNIRKILIDNCKILKVINVSGGAFNSTGVKTKILIFKKEKGIDNHKNIEFLEINKNCNEVKLIAIADLDKNYSFKLKVNQEIIKYNSNVEMKTLGEIFNLNGNGSTNSKDITNSGEYPFYRASCNNPSGTHCKYDFDGKEYLLIIKSGGCANKPISSDYGIGKVFIVNGKCAANIAVFQLILKNEEIYDIKYLYYYLIHIQSSIQELALYCTNNGNINMKELMNLKIPIPSIETQKELVKRIYLFENSNKDIIKLIENLKEFNKIKLESSFNKDIELIEFRQMFDLIKGTIQSSKVIEEKNGLYPIISIAEKNKLTNIIDKKYLIDGENIFIASTSSGTSCGPYETKIKYYNGICSYTNLLSKIQLNKNYYKKINIKYIYYYLLNKKEYIEETYEKGCANKSLDVEEFNLMKIPIPSIEVQEEIINYCDNNLKIIENLNKTIEGNKKIIKDIMTSI
jgi:type I restriction-modification system DNA methylase subunit/restriction endonuclease S subunit